MSESFQRRWQDLWAVMGILPPPSDSLLQLYAEPHRHYHNATHILACLDELAKYSAATRSPADPALTLALFYHDAIYDPHKHDNEIQSAELARRQLSPHLPPSILDTITRLIQFTDHKSPATQPDEQLIVDLDLSILGQQQPTFDTYESAIRAEYAHVPDPQFKTGRSTILRHFLTRPRIYHTPWFFEQYEAPARVNLARSLARLTPST